MVVAVSTTMRYPIISFIFILTLCIGLTTCILIDNKSGSLISTNMEELMESIWLFRLVMIIIEVILIIAALYIDSAATDISMWSKYFVGLVSLLSPGNWLTSPIFLVLGVLAGLCLYAYPKRRFTSYNECVISCLLAIGFLTGLFSRYAPWMFIAVPLYAAMDSANLLLEMNENTYMLVWSLQMTVVVFCCFYPEFNSEVKQLLNTV